MEKNYIALRKTHFLRNKNKNEIEAGESRMNAQKIPVRDKYCQTDHDVGPFEQVSEPGDPPLLQQQVQTSKSGIQQIIECFRSGTKQLKHMLLREVDTIFECKTCRSLFRGLPNLITHKQFYCLSKVCVDENPPNENDRQSRAIKDLLEAIYPKVNEPEYVIKLEPIQTNKNAVFQYVTPADAANECVRKGPVPDSDEIQVDSPTSNKTLATEIAESTPTVRLKRDLTTFDLKKPVITDCVVSLVKEVSITHPFSCRVCKKDFNCRRGVRRHLRRVHKKKLEDIKKFIELQRRPILTTARGLSIVDYTPSGTKCQVCFKSFATKANVRRHVDEVHKGMRRDSPSEAPTKPGIALETGSPKKSLKTQKSPVNSDFTLSSCKCPYCKRRYTSRFLLKKHVQIVHKTILPAVHSKLDKGHTGNTDSKVKVESSVDSTATSGSHSPQNELKGANNANEKKSTLTTQKNKVKTDADSPKASLPVVGSKKKYQKTKLTASFDFKQLYCKLCKRQFTSKENLSKHIELHTDGNGLYVKFYRCPLCNYETRRKRDVIRHITVVHKKTAKALVKLTANLESRAIKKPIDCILSKDLKRGPQKDATKTSPIKKQDGVEASIEVKVTKNFSLLKCNKCGKAFAKKADLEHHKKTHKTNSNNSSVETKGRSTRSKMHAS
ncbi:zinc finger protein 800 isoform X2 [Bombina bombina]|uniref:zinc finger protein 800 isoform X2 n=1 Tax=Bombina bombina TaxID=8345 RepID=UPI00235AA7AB|nr:zinc finger protein 800 isoform X2 [Bombina bombina]